MNNIGFNINIFDLLKTPQFKSIQNIKVNGINIQKVSAESSHSLEIVSTNPFTEERKSYYKIVEECIKDCQKNDDNVFKEAVYAQCIEEITGALSPYFVVIKNVGLSFALKENDVKIDKDIVRILNTALTLGFVKLNSKDITPENLSKIANEVKDIPVNIYFYNYWDINEYNIFFNREEEELDYYEIKYRQSSIDKLWGDLDRLYTYFKNAGTRHYRYKPVLYIDCPVTKEMKKRWLSFKNQHQNNPLVDDYADVSVELDFRNFKINLKIIDENIRKYFIFDLKTRRVKNWEQIREMFFQTEDYIFRYLLSHPFNRRFERIEKLNETIKTKAVFYKVEANEFGMAFEEPREDFRLIKTFEYPEYFDYIDIYQYGDLNLYFIKGISTKRSVNFGAFFVDLVENEIENFQLLEENYLSLLTNSSIKNFSPFYNQKDEYLLPSLKPGQIALQIIKEDKRIKRI